MDKIKTIAMYLPQYHQIPENDLWWGEGFTEWVTVRNAEKIIECQCQPREPLDDNYYCLLDKDTLFWQANIMKEYNIDGLCFYHYYFKDDRKVLEKPAELLLENKDIEMPFCFCWANETWARTWSKLASKNVWADKFETAQTVENIENGILLEQKYGREEEWKKHFEYLLPFFKDDRYIKLNGRCIFVIYQPWDIANLAEMFFFWNTLCRENGLQELYVIGANTRKLRKGLDSILYSGPAAYLSRHIGCSDLEVLIEHGIKCYEYDDVWNNAINLQGEAAVKTYYGGFVGYDSTPRRGTNGIIIKNSTPEKFEYYMYKLAQKNIGEGNEFLFINAWNEWGEGMYLEPDKVVGYGYLEAIKNVMKKIEECHCCDIVKNNRITKLIMPDNRDLHFEYFKLMDQWLTIKESKKNLAEYLINRGFKEVAIYGVGVLGKHLISELKESEILVKYVIDRNEEIKCYGISKRKLSDDWEMVDAIIVTPTYYYDEIWETIRSKVDYPIISLQEMIKEV